MITKTVSLNIQKGVQKRLDLIQKEIKIELERSFQKVYGSDKSLKAYYNTPTLQSTFARQRYSGKAKSELRQLYVKAWQNTYTRITQSYEQNPKWEKRKRYQKGASGFAPYGLTESDQKKEASATRGRERLGISRRTSRYRVRYTGTGLYTGFLRESIAKGFARGGNEFISVSGDNNFAGYVINVEAFPKSEGESYVSQYIDFLIEKGAFSSIEEIFSFTSGDQDKIAAFMVRTMENEFIPKFADQMADIASKVNRP
jgi:hypothetical protein